MLKNSGCFIGCLFFLSFIVAIVPPKSASAYPQNIAKGYVTCASCHYSPDGGGMLTAYGVATMQSMFPDALDLSFVHTIRQALQKKIVAGQDDDGSTAYQWDVGLDSRILAVNGIRDSGKSVSLVIFPMLIEAQAIVALGPWSAYGSLLPRKKGSSKSHNYVFSRHHWLQYRYTEELSVRVGRLSVPFGIRNPDHTAYARRNLNQNKYDQSYGIQLDWNSEYWAASVMGIANQNLSESTGQERGLSGRIAYLSPGQRSIGFSALGVMSNRSSRLAGGLFIQSKLWNHTYLLAELDIQSSSNFRQTNNQLVSYARLGWMIAEWFDLFSEFHHQRFINKDNMHSHSSSVGFNWQIFPGIEIASVVQFTKLASREVRSQVYGQLHLIY